MAPRVCVCYALYLQRYARGAQACSHAQGRVPDALRFGSALQEGQDRHCHGHTGMTHRGRLAPPQQPRAGSGGHAVTAWVMLIASMKAGGTSGGTERARNGSIVVSRLAASRHHGAHPNTPTPHRLPRAIAAGSRAATLPTHHPSVAQRPGPPRSCRARALASKGNSRSRRRLGSRTRRRSSPRPPPRARAASTRAGAAGGSRARRVRLGGQAASAPRGAARCARRCGASARWRAERHHERTPPQAEQLEPEEQPHRPLQRLRVKACARVCLPMRRAARSAQHDVAHDEASRGMPPTSHRRHQLSAQQQCRPQQLQDVALASAAACVRGGGRVDAPSSGPSCRWRGAATARTP